MNKNSFFKIFILIICLIFIVGGFLGWRYWFLPKEENIILEEEKVITYPENSVKLATIGERFNLEEGNNSILFSPDKSQVAYIAKKDGKWFMIVNDQVSEAYDNILLGFHFSPDSKQLAYAASKEGKWFLVLNGEKGKNYDDITRITFSPDSQKLAFVATNDGKSFVVLNDKEGKSYDYIFWEPTFSSDSGQLAYGASEGGNMFVVVNNKEEKKYSKVFNLVFSPDSKKLAYVARDKEKGATVVVNGKEGKYYEDASNITFSPDSKQIVYAAQKKEVQYEPSWSPAEWIVVINELEGKIYDFVTAQKGILTYEKFSFSPDSKQLAYIAGNAEKESMMHLIKEFFIVLNGQEGKVYKKILSPNITQVESPLFSPDSKRLVFIARNEYEMPDGFHKTNQYIVINGKEVENNYTINPTWNFGFVSNEPAFIFSPDSKKIAYVAGKEYKSGVFVVVDNWESKIYDGVSEPIFSSDGKHIIYGAKIGNELWVIVDKIED